MSPPEVDAGWTPGALAAGRETVEDLISLGLSPVALGAAGMATAAFSEGVREAKLCLVELLAPGPERHAAARFLARAMLRSAQVSQDELELKIAGGGW